MLEFLENSEPRKFVFVQWDENVAGVTRASFESVYSVAAKRAKRETCFDPLRTHPADHTSTKQPQVKCREILEQLRQVGAIGASSSSCLLFPIRKLKEVECVFIAVVLVLTDCLIACRQTRGVAIMLENALSLLDKAAAT